MFVDGCRKVGKKPSLEQYDNRSSGNSSAYASDENAFGYNRELVAYEHDTKARDKAILSDLGVSGDASLAQARINARLDVDPNDIRNRWLKASREVRGSGNTAAQLMELQPDDAFVATGDVQYVVRLLRHLRGADFVRSVRVVSGRSIGGLAGLRGRIVIDHDYYWSVPFEQFCRVKDFMEANNRRFPANDNKIAARKVA
jgi:hypothetical protein